MAKSYSTPPAMSIDTKKEYTATFDTSRGTIVCDLFTKDAPNTVNNFVFLAREKFYDGTTFHRVIANFMIQGGDPTGTGRGGPGYKFEDETKNNPHKHQVGSLIDGQRRSEHERQPVLHHPHRHRLAERKAHRLRTGPQRSGSRERHPTRRHSKLRQNRREIAPQIYPARACHTSDF